MKITKLLYRPRHWLLLVAYYKDGIHPTPEGNRVLVGILGDVLAAR